MFSHIMVGANDIEESKVFYDAVLGTLGCKPGILSMNLSDQKRYMYIHEKNIFIITEPIDGNSATHGNGATVGFSVADEATGDKWHEAGLNAGGTACEDPPGIREGMGVKMYLAYLKDPSGNKICALKRLG
jgi:catechol 2,3-dioxygenase-like lactoylglutathione lyase family enzyme